MLDLVSSHMSFVKGKFLLCLVASIFLMPLSLMAVDSSAAKAKAKKTKAVPQQAPVEPCKKWNVFGDFLVWYASEQPNDSWASVIDGKLNSNGSVTANLSANGISFGWDFGFRVGMDYSLPHDNWDTQAYWTWFRTQATSHIPDTGGLAVAEYFAAFLNNSAAKSANINWTLLYNMIDWELGRNYCVSKSLNIRPFIGLKGGTIYQKIHSHWNLTDFSSQENLKNNFWGVGPSGGVNTQWKLRSFESQSISLIADFSGAMLWGTWIFSDEYSSPVKQVSIKGRNLTLGAFMLRNFMGFGWDIDLNKKRNHLAVQLGFETQIWFNQLRLVTFQQIRLHGDLTLQGGTLRCSFDF